MEFLVLAWFVLIQTDSPLLVGLYGALRFTGTLFAPFYGIIVDRYDRPKLLTASRLTFTLIAVIIAAVSFLGQIQVWHVFILTGIAGMVRAFDNVTRQTLIADLVDRQDIANAVALTRTGRDTTQIMSPIIGGMLLSSFGLGWTYIVVIAMHLCGTALVTLIHQPPRAPAASGASIMSILMESLRYARTHQVILGLLLLAFLVNLTGFPLNQGLAPVFAHDVLQTDSSGLGLLLSAYSAGALIGSGIIAYSADFISPGRMMIIASIAWHLAVAALSQSNWFITSLGVMALAGIAQSFTMVTMAFILLGYTPTHIRGRIQGLRSLAVYGLPLGLLASGAIADTFGISAALIANGSIGIIATIIIVLPLKSMWRS